MKVDVWLDFVCPFCYMGDKQFKKELEGFPSLRNDLNINYRSFELNPSKQKYKKGSTVEELAKTYHMPIEKAKYVMEKTVKKVEAVGLTYRYKEVIPANTFDAHRLNYYAKEFNKEEVMTERIMKAHFAEGVDISDQSVLTDLAGEVGFSKEEVAAILNSDKYSGEIAADQKEAKKLGIDTVPTLIFEDGSRISGVLSTEDYVAILQDLNK